MFDKYLKKKSSHPGIRANAFSRNRENLSIIPVKKVRGELKLVVHLSRSAFI